MSYTVGLNSQLILSLYYMYKVKDVSCTHPNHLIYVYLPRVGQTEKPHTLCCVLGNNGLKFNFMGFDSIGER